MFRVDDIMDEARKIVGICDDTKLFRWLGDAVSMIANKSDLEGWKGVIDICTCDCSCCGSKCATMPREIETVLAVSSCGRPLLGYGQLFNFHLNGPGDVGCSPCDWSWMDMGQYHSTYRDLLCPSKLVAYLQTAEDNGKEVIVFGYDKFGNVLRRNEGGVWRNGYAVPTIFGYAVPDSEAPDIARITGVFKEETVGSVRLSTIDEAGNTGILLGIYEPDEKTPQYRRIKINRPSKWLRVAYLKNNPTFSSRYDHIALKSRVALLLALQARKYYTELRLAEGHAFEADAARMELEAQLKAEAPLFNPVQVVSLGNDLKSHCDYDIH